jgi:aspartate dehydrogenase
VTRLALLGAGAIAQQVAGSLAGCQEIRVVAVAATTSTSPGVAACSAAVGYEIPFHAGPDLASADAEWVFEAAGAQAARETIPNLLEAGKNVVAMSSGVFLDRALLERCRPALAAGRRLVFPPGAIAGLDAIAALARSGGVTEMRLTSTKAPRSLWGAPFFKGQELDDNFAGIVFEGDAATAAREFPANANIAATLAFAGVGPERTRVRIKSDPAAKKTRHEIVCRSSGASLEVAIVSEPSPINPRSSLMAALSATDVIFRVLSNESGFVEPVHA